MDDATADTSAEAARIRSLTHDRYDHGTPVGSRFAEALVTIIAVLIIGTMVWLVGSWMYQGLTKIDDCHSRYDTSVSQGGGDRSYDQFRQDQCPGV